MRIPYNCRKSVHFQKVKSNFYTISRKIDVILQNQRKFPLQVQKSRQAEKREKEKKEKRVGRQAGRKISLSSQKWSASQVRGRALAERGRRVHSRDVGDPPGA